MFEKVADIIRADTNDLKDLAKIAGGNPKTFYVGINLSDCNVRRSDLVGFGTRATTFCEDEQANQVLRDVKISKKKGLEVDNNVASYLNAQGRYDEPEPLYGKGLSCINGCLAFAENEGEFRLLKPSSCGIESISPKLSHSDHFVLSGLFLLTLSRWYARARSPESQIQTLPFYYLDSIEISVAAKVAKRSIYSPLQRLNELGLVETKYRGEGTVRGRLQMWSLTQAGLHLRVQILLDLGVTAVKGV